MSTISKIKFPSTPPSSTQGDFGGLKNQVDKHEWLIGILVVALFIGFAGVFVAATAMLVDAFRGKQATYQNLVDKISDQSYKNDALMKELEAIKANQVNKFNCTYQKGGLTCQP